MRPRSVERGKPQPLRLDLQTVRRFNEAALSRARKVADRKGWSLGRTGFNEAALSRARKVGRRRQMPDRRPCFNEAALSRARKDAHRAIRIGDKCRFNEAALSRARKDNGNPIDQVATISASMRPRSVERGKEGSE